MVGPEKVIEKIKDAVNAKKLTGIADVIDLTDRNHGLRLVIELKNGFNPNAVLAQLYKFTPMEDSFGINNVALVEGQPRTLGLLELLTVYVEHRLQVVRRRTEHRLAKKQDRLHLVEGLLIAIVDIDEVIPIIRSSDETAQARERLMAIFDLSELQANYILELRLRQLTKFSRIELEKEAEELRAAIEELEAILDSDELLRELVSGGAGGDGREVRHPAPHRAAGIRVRDPAEGHRHAGGGRHRQEGAAEPGDRRRPVPGAALGHRPGGPHRVAWSRWTAPGRG